MLSEPPLAQLKLASVADQKAHCHSRTSYGHAKLLSQPKSKDSHRGVEHSSTLTENLMLR